MKIAYISFEYPPDTSGGGIGSYTEQVSLMMASAGHDVTVFCATHQQSYNHSNKGVNLYRIQASNVEIFRHNVVSVFGEAYKKKSFDLIEGPDFGADAYFIKKSFPQIPYIIKLHTPVYIINEFNNYYRQYVLPNMYWQRLKNYLRSNKIYDYNKSSDIEYLNALMAEQIFSPSRALAKRISKDWEIDKEKISIVPNPYLPNESLLSIPLSYEHHVVTFIGKLSILKGAVDFIRIIPAVLKKMPHLKFRFVGDDSFSPQEGKSMSQYILEKCSYYKSQIEFVGKVPLTKVSEYFAQTDIVVCNSLWENYPTVILEAMSAGRVVIATKAGGIPEIIDHGRNGILLDKKDSAKIAQSIIDCYNSREKMIEFGREARAFIAQFSSGRGLLGIIENQYKQMVAGI